MEILLPSVPKSLLYNIFSYLKINLSKAKYISISFTVNFRSNAFTSLVLRNYSRVDIHLLLMDTLDTKGEMINSQYFNACILELEHRSSDCDI
jgi:hypothetical protein